MTENQKANISQKKDENSFIRLANKIPNPFILFFYLIIFIAIVSTLLAGIGVSTTMPSTGKIVEVKAILSWDGLNYTLLNMMKNFTNFRPFGLVFLMILSVGFLSETGFFKALFKNLFQSIKPSLIAPSIVLIGVIGNVASDSSVFIIPPLAGLAFALANRNPIAGIFLGMVACFSGFTANILITGTDALLSGVSTEALQAVEPGGEVNVLANWFFMAASVPIIIIVLTFTNKFLIEPRLNKSNFNLPHDEAIRIATGSNEDDNKVSDKQKRALRKTGIVAVIVIAIILLLLLPESSSLRNPVTKGILPSYTDAGDLIRSPFLDSVVPFIALFAIVLSIFYGYSSGTIKTQNDIPKLMATAVKDVSGFFVMIFMISQFISLLNWTNLSTIIAVKGANAASSLALPSLLLLIFFIILATFINLFIYSGSAQWALMAPIFLPLLYQLDIPPEIIQAAYRIGDSSSNVISPISPYVVLCLVFINKYRSDFTLGHFLYYGSIYVACLLSSWTIFFSIWYTLGLPFGL